MFNYLGNITDLSHHIIKHYTPGFKTAVDCTLGNGGDTDFLADNFEVVYAFDIQSEAVSKYELKGRSNVTAICSSHAQLDQYVERGVDVIMFNLGFLPGGDKTITTRKDSSMIAIEKSLDLLVSGGLLLVAVYTGHDEGKIEGDAIMEYMVSLPKDKFGVMLHRVVNRSEKSPYLLVVEKR